MCDEKHIKNATALKVVREKADSFVMVMHLWMFLEMNLWRSVEWAPSTFTFPPNRSRKFEDYLKLGIEVVQTKLSKHVIPLLITTSYIMTYIYGSMSEWRQESLLSCYTQNSDLLLAACFNLHDTNYCIMRCRRRGLAFFVISLYLRCLLPMFAVCLRPYRIHYYLDQLKPCLYA